MRKITLEELFADAPYYRRHEAFIGAKYHIKDPDDPNAPGLWFAKTPGQIIVAKKKPRLNHSLRIAFGNGHIEGDTDDFAVAMGEGSKEATLRQYDFIPVEIAPGDAIYDYHLTFKGFRDGWDGDLSRMGADPDAYFSGMYKAERDNGALIRTVIPAAEFHAKYELDEVGKCYREKPYRKKFVEGNQMVILPDGTAEQIAAECEAILIGNDFSFQKLPIHSGSDTRLICGQPLSFYTKELMDFQGPQPSSGDPLRDLMGHMALSLGDEGLGYHGIVVTRPGQKPRNPYGAFLGIYNMAASAFNKAGMKLSEEQQGEFDNHLRDITLRFDYFERNPIVPENL